MQSSNFNSSTQVGAGLLLAVLGVWLLAFSLPTLTILLPEWWGAGSYNYGLFNTAIAAYLVYQRKHELKPSTRLKAIWFWPVAVALFMAWQFTAIANIRTLELAVSFALLYLLLLHAYGVVALNILLFPFSLIVIALPIWRWLQELLQAITTEVSDLLLSLSALPYLRTGYRFELPGGIFDVEPGCSGFNFFMIGLTLSIVFASLNRLSLLKSILVIGFSIAIALIGNWLRVIIIIIVGNETQMQHPLVADHVTFGWILYLVLFIPLFYVLTRFASEEDDGEASSEQPSFKLASRIEALFFDSTNTSRMPLLIIFACLVSLFPAVNHGIKHFAVQKEKTYSVSFESKSYSFNPASKGDMSPNFPAAESRYFMLKRNSVQSVELFIASYGLQREGAEITDKENRFYPESWQRRSKEIISLDANRTYSFESLQSAGGKTFFLLSSYKIGSHHYADLRTAKLKSALATLGGNPNTQVISLGMRAVKGQTHQEASAILLDLADQMLVNDEAY